MSEEKTVYWAPDPATILKLYTEMEKGEFIKVSQNVVFLLYGTA